VERTPANPGDTVLSIEGLRVAGPRGGDAVKGISLDVRAGEIVGIAGVVGNGQSELLDAIVGLRPTAAGTIRIGELDLSARTVRGRFEAGLSHVPEDRHHRGLVLSFSIEENLILGRQHRFGGPLGLDSDKIRQEAERLIEDVDIRPDDPEAIAADLSGGNQQKVVVARELARHGAKLLLCAQPTRGVDIGAIELIHKRIIAARDDGLAVLLVSADLTELMALSDRVAVMYGGEIVEILEADDVVADGARARVGGLMTGASA
jgi:simple sugar transport system ATP-binding protein